MKNQKENNIIINIDLTNKGLDLLLSHSSNIDYMRILRDMNLDKFGDGTDTASVDHDQIVYPTTSNS